MNYFYTRTPLVKGIMLTSEISLKNNTFLFNPKLPCFYKKLIYDADGLPQYKLLSYL